MGENGLIQDFQDMVLSELLFNEDTRVIFVLSNIAARAGLIMLVVSLQLRFGEHSSTYDSRSDALEHVEDSSSTSVNEGITTSCECPCCSIYLFIYLFLVATSSFLSSKESIHASPLPRLPGLRW